MSPSLALAAAESGGSPERIDRAVRYTPTRISFLITGAFSRSLLIHARVSVQVHRLRAAAYGRLGSRNLEKLFDLFDEDGNRELVMSILLGRH